MITYRMMDNQTLLCRCMHGGSVPLALASDTIPQVSQSVIERFLRKMVDSYGSCGVMALDGDTIIGVLWFYPLWIKEKFGGVVCIQGENYETLSHFGLNTIPGKEELPDRILWIECLMVVRSVIVDYTGRGIGKGMLEYLLGWAKENQWSRIRAQAIADIKPLMLWSGMYTVSRYQALGFEVVNGSSTTNPGLLEGANSQKSGYHGPEFQRMWDEEYIDIDDVQIAQVQIMEIALN